MKHYTQEDILRYLSGSFSPSEVKALNTHIMECKECNALLNTELEFEIALIDAKDSPSDCIIPQSSIDKMVEKAITETENPGSQKEDKEETEDDKEEVESKTGKNRTYLWAMAAAVLITFTALLIRFASAPSPQIAEIDTLANKPETTVATVVKEMREPPAPARVIKFDRKTHAVPSQTAAVRIVSQSESEAVAAIDSGSALFSVEPNRYASFVVETPDAEIRVTGTVFDVWVSEGSTKVTVLEGKVIVNYKKLKESVAVAKNHLSVIEEGKVEVKTSAETDTASLSEYRKILPVDIQSVVSSVTNIEPQTAQPVQKDIWSEKLDRAIEMIDNRSYLQAYNSLKDIMSARPGGRNEEIARFEAANLLIKQLNRKDDGLKVLEEYLATYKDGAFEEEALLELVKSGNGKPASVYNHTTAFITKYSDHPYARRAAYEHATLLREAGQFNLASSLYGSFVKLWPKDNRVEDALYWQGKSSFSAGDSLGGRKIMTAYSQKYPEGRWIREAASMLSGVK
ncbi:MAG: FecR domain-containing protein [Fibrobacteres bacterium]|nr:FecR domain-containing protein [Fibrobacterota bacterium]